MLAEVMIENATEVRTAQHLGAHSVLLARHVGRGGTSPDLKTLSEVREAVRIPLTVLVRPDHQGFSYEKERKDKLLSHLKAYRNADIERIALTVLDEDAVDVFFLEDILAFGFQITFQDFNNLKHPVQMVKMLGMYPRITRLVTRGNAVSSWEGREVIRDLVPAARHGLEVFAESTGLTHQSMADFVRNSGVAGVQFGAQCRDSSGRLDLVMIEQFIDILLHKSLKRF
ncbi:copper homeostasis protein CutC [Deinococcus roseus]|uniref:Copper homeostasis protein cutC homolog n=1 Tax=Deinococcus roseus TaxID=392414 RepID=A0ABQ2CU53_9DEIO|nr:copper homeostasis protein CutC [Deinococcus roseus]GGJ20386.1 hypothetical protein GCM10008938_03280 [Deinococcus roseus]